MRSINQLSVLATLAVLLFGTLLFAAAANATSERYRYQSDTYDYAEEPFDSTMSSRAYIKFTENLASNLTNEDVLPLIVQLAWDNGVEDVNKLQPHRVFDEFIVSTDSDGAIISWAMELSFVGAGGYVGGFAACNGMSLVSEGTCQTHTFGDVVRHYDSSATTSASGYWVPVNPIPEPSTASLLALGLVGLAAMRRQRANLKGARRH